MLDAFWTGLGEEFARNWAARILSPAFAFWVGGLAAVWWSANADDVRRSGWRAELDATTQWLQGLPVIVQGALVVIALVLVAVSALVVEQLTRPLLRVLEGYWTRPRWLRNLLVRYRRWRLTRVDERVRDLRLRQRRGGLGVSEYAQLRRLRTTPSADPARLTELEARVAERLAPHEAMRLGRGLRLLRTTPEEDFLRMPTRLGDILRSAERRPTVTYGLDAVLCWNALWFLLPAETRAEVAQARARLDGSVRSCLWGFLFVGWTPWTWWAAPVGVLTAVLSYRSGALPAAAAFGELVVTSYDVHRMKLYDALHLPRPTSPRDERTVAGKRVTDALWGVLDGPGLAYRFDQPAPPPTPT